VGEKPWFALRAKAATAPSTKFTPSAVAALLSMSGEKSANDNVLLGLRRLGIIDDDGLLTARGNKWRVDSSYAEACEDILNSVYPTELQSLTDDHGNADKAKVATWLQHKGQGESSAKQMASTYAMIASKSPAPAPAATPASPKQSAYKPKTSTAASVATSQAALSSDDIAKPQNASGSDSPSPTIHLDIQVHIPPAASAEQIDQIFASMAKHLYRQ